MADTTIVFEINLSASDECREWSYLELVQNHLVHNRRDDGENNPFSEKESIEEQKLKELAKSLERKYGTMVTVKKSGKRKRVRIDDFLDPGEGYDTQDSFIDDSEAVDVFLAPNISTKHGGFYVYEGSLEGLEYQDAEIEAPVGAKPTTTAISRTGAKKNKSKELLEKAVKCLSAPKQSPGVSRSKMQHLDSVFDAVLSNPPTSDVDTAKSGIDTPIRNTSDCAKTKSVPNDSEQPSRPPISETIPPPLPNSLPAEVTNAVANLIKLASANGPTPRRLLGRPFELELVNLASALNGANVSQSARSTVFAHIEGVLHWKRKSLMRRLKKLNETNEDQKIHPLLDALCDAISRAMPALLESYLRDKESHAERLKTWQAENAEPVESLSVNPDGNAPKRNPKPGAPKKLFRWNTECRDLFQSIIKLRLESYHTLNMKGPREEYLRSLFPTLIQFWPDGWITNAALWRAALPIFQRFTIDRPDRSSNTSPSKLTTLLTTTSTPKPIPSTAAQLPISCSTTSVSAQSIASGNLSSGLSKGKPPQGSNRLTVTPPNVHTSMGVTVSQSRSPIACTSSAVLTIPVSERNGSTQSPTLANLSGSLTSVAAKLPHPQQAVRSMLQARPDQPIVERHNYSPKQNSRIGSPPPIHSAVKTTAVKSRTIGSVAITNEARMSLLVQNISAQQLSAPIMSNVIKYSSPPVHVNHTYLMQQKAPDNTARQPSPVVCGSVHLTSTGSVSLADTCKPTATVPGKVQRMPDSVDSCGVQYIPHPRRQTEPGVLQKYISLAPNSMPAGHLSTLNATNLITQTPTSAVQVANSFAGAQGNSTHLHSSSALALATNQINQLQQRAIASTVRPALKMNSTLAAATSVLLQRQPPPAHQQMSPSQGFPQRSTDCYIALLPSAHASSYTNTSHLASSKPPTTSKSYDKNQPTS